MNCEHEARNRDYDEWEREWEVMQQKSDAKDLRIGHLLGALAIEHKVRGECPGEGCVVCLLIENRGRMCAEAGE